MLRRTAVSSFTIFALAVVALTTPVSAQSTSGPQTQSPSKQLMRDIWDGWATLDTANVSRFYDKNATDTFFDVTPLKYKGWSAYESGVKSVLAQWQSMKATINDDAEVHANGNLYWGTATVHLEITPKQGNPMNLDVRWTALWQKQAKQWLIVHEHVSTPMQQ
ncbi:MAG TPA: nuclear transport factor 2 family protein [Candidatus Sulfotelmatobacter sp.]|nr:nuclear transport factor 2 family protein [Candidatus Sulfotelmatobacter sp.]